MSYKYAAITFLMLLVMGLATWTSFLSYQTTSKVENKSSRPDAFMEEVTALVFDKQGKPHMKIATPKMIHYAENDTTQLEYPELTLFRKSPKPWYIKSKYAKAINGVDDIYFWDNVLIHHAADLNHPATLIKTSTLLVHSNKKIVETTDNIILIQPNLTIKAIGMYADMNNGDIKLLSQARGEYEPSS